MDALQRIINAAAEVDPSEWWTELPAEQKHEYIEEHPHSKYADQAIEETRSKKTSVSNEDQAGSEERKKLGSSIAKQAPKIAGILKRAFPRITHATSALKHLATGQKLTHDQKETLHEFGALAIKTAIGHITGPESAKLLGNVGITAVRYGIEKFKQHRANSSKDDVEVFVNSIAEGVAHAKTAGVPAEHASPKSAYRTALAKHFKKNVSHVVEVVNRSFKDIKPAMQGLSQLAHRQPLDDAHKQAVKNLGKVALGVSIAALPGGLAAHLAAGVGASAITYAIKRIQKGEHHGSILHHFVEAIGEGLEDALIESGDHE